MYHRNKVHTDEFWKYELAKHRRTVLDSKTNEDMWKKQLGKHADEVIPAHPHHFPPHIEHEKEEMKRSPDQWLEQIKLSTSTDPNQNNQVSTEMKLLALQSLQSSLQMMNNMPHPPPKSSSASEVGAGMMSRPQTPPSCSPPTLIGPPAAPASAASAAPTPTPTAPSNGYLNLLASLSVQQPKALTEQFGTNDFSERPRKSSECSTASSPPYLPDIKEECATKRTQMWLAQLGRYRQKSFQDEMDRNHEELWEEQIAKVKHNPVRSPIEPIQINLAEDDESEARDATHVSAAEEVRGGLKPQAEVIAAPPASALPVRKSIAPPRMIPLMSALECYPPPRRPSTPIINGNGEKILRPPTPVSPIPNVISIKTSAISRVENQPRTFSLNLEINNNNDSLLESTPHRRHIPAIPVPVIPTSRENPPLVKRRLLEIPEDDLAPVAAPEIPTAAPLADHEEEAAALASAASNTGAVDDSSVLKSLLMDRLPRKRPLSPIEAKKRPSISGESDILRKRLLGLKSEPEQPVVPMVKPRFQPPSATITSEQVSIEEGHQKGHIISPAGAIFGQSNPVDLRKEDNFVDQQPPSSKLLQHQQPPKSYTQTSVLKHLLYRYTASENPEGDHQNQH